MRSLVQVRKLVVVAHSTEPSLTLLAFLRTLSAIQPRGQNPESVRKLPVEFPIEEESKLCGISKITDAIRSENLNFNPVLSFSSAHLNDELLAFVESQGLRVLVQTKAQPKDPLLEPKYRNWLKKSKNVEVSVSMTGDFKTFIAKLPEKTIWHLSYLDFNESIPAEPERWYEDALETFRRAVTQLETRSEGPESELLARFLEKSNCRSSKEMKFLTERSLIVDLDGNVILDSHLPICYGRVEQQFSFLMGRLSFFAYQLGKEMKLKCSHCECYRFCRGGMLNDEARQTNDRCSARKVFFMALNHALTEI